MSTREGKYEMWRSPNSEQWHWHFKAANGETIASGQGYTARHNCLKAISLLQNSTRAKIYSLSEPRKRPGYKPK
jgi:uncharacterized protein YegP (UPF0339 family)